MKYLVTKALKTGRISSRTATPDIAAVIFQPYEHHSQCYCNVEAYHSHPAQRYRQLILIDG